MNIFTFICIWFVFALVGGWRFYAWKNESREGITLDEYYAYYLDRETK